MHVEIKNPRETIQFEAGAPLAELAFRILVTSRNSKRPSEGLASSSVRNGLRASFSTSLTEALRVEEMSVRASTQAISQLSGEALSAFGDKSLGVPRGNLESDENYKNRLRASIKLEDQPYRKAIETRIEAMVSELLEDPLISGLVSKVETSFSE